jgi:hypothetical protein
MGAIDGYCGWSTFWRGGSSVLVSKIYGIDISVSVAVDVLWSLAVDMEVGLTILNIIYVISCIMITLSVDGNTEQREKNKLRNYFHFEDYWT